MQQFHTQEYPAANRNYKDRLFRFVFKNKKDLLDLYNAINGTDYDNPEELEVNTLENVLYLSMKNDLSFLIDAELNLYEHQSTYNPNMPMRGLLYFAGVYNRHISSREINIYSSSPKEFPFPQHIVFYNGTQEEPDRKILKLSDLFRRPNGEKEPCLECQTLMLNINYGHNRELMKKCRLRHLRGHHSEKSGKRARSSGSSGRGGGKLYCRRDPGGYPESAESRGGTDGTGRF